MKKILILSIIFLTSCGSSNKPDGRYNTDIVSIQNAIDLRVSSMRFSSQVRVVPVVNGEFVLIVGQVPNPSIKDEIVEEISRVRGVSKVYNELEVREVISLFDQTSDSMITAKVKANLYNSPFIPINTIKVITEGSNVYLLGNVFRSVAKLAGKLAKVDGAKKVVLFFNYLD